MVSKSCLIRFVNHFFFSAFPIDELSPLSGIGKEDIFSKISFINLSK